MMVGEWLRAIGVVSTVDLLRIEHLRDDLDTTARAAAGLIRSHADPALSLPLRLSKSLLANLESCERRALAVAGSGSDLEMSAPMLAGRALDQFVAHRLFVGRVLEPLPVLDEMFDACGDQEAHDALAQMEKADAVDLLEPMAAAADAWADVDEDWQPRLQSRAVAMFADGDVICSGVLDVELGGAGTPHPGVVVEVKSGSVASSHAHEVYLYALLVALRDRRAPAVVARWYPGKMPAGVEVTDGLLSSTTERLRDAMMRWSELTCGDPPAERPGPWCDWCPELTDCQVGTTAVANRGEVANGGDVDSR
ncbi:MAG: hypothetical protein V9E94_17000 [Microthrixaceae bacterium]